MKYQILSVDAGDTDSDIDYEYQLEQAVNKAIAKGWKPQGGISFGGGVWTQAMTLDGEER